MNTLLSLILALFVREPFDCLAQAGFYTPAALQYAAAIPVKHVPQGNAPGGGDVYRYVDMADPPYLVWVDNPNQDHYWFCFTARHEYGHAFDDLYGWRSRSRQFTQDTRDYGLDLGWKVLRVWRNSSEKYADMSADYPCNLLPYSRYFPQFDFRKACHRR